MDRLHPIILSEGILKQASEHVLKMEKEASLRLAAERERHKPFFAKSYNPKVQVPYSVPQGVCPREIVIAGLKKEFAEVKIEELIPKAGITDEDIMPLSAHINYDVVRHEVAGEGTIMRDEFLPFLPLEMFDDTDYDCYTPKEWIGLGQQFGEKKPVPAFAFLPSTKENISDKGIKYEWMRVGVIDYDEDKEAYFVKKFEAGTESILGGIINKFTDEHWVPRLRLMFMAEDPHKFVERILHALKLRKETEARLRYSFFIDCMPCDILAPPDQHTINRILGKTEPLEGKYASVIPKVLPNITKVYNYATNQRIFHNIVMRHQNIFTYVEFPEKKTVVTPKQGYKFEEEIMFNNLRLQFCARTFLTKEEIIISLVGVITELLKVQEVNLLHLGGVKAVRLEDYIKSQEDSLWHVSTYVHDTMLKNLRHIIRLALTNCTTGWYNIYEKNWYVYESSKMKKFMNMVHYRIQDALRFMVERGLSAFSKLIVYLCGPSLHLEEEYEWEDFKSDYFRPSDEPLMMLHLLIEKGQVCYSSDIQDIIDKIVYIFDRGVETISKVPQLERFILEDLFWGEMSMLGCIAMNEDHINKWRNDMRDALETTLVPMESYCQLFERFLELANIDLFEFLKEYEENEKATLQIKEDIAYYYQKYDELAEILPKENTICIFLINLDDTRRVLMSKCKSIAQNLETLLAKQLRAPIDEICKEYCVIYDKLMDTPGCIEDIVEMRVWMKDIPDMVKEIAERAEGIYEAYNVLDEFLFNLPDDDFAQKWEAIGYPYKIHEQMKTIYDQFITDEEKFRNILVKDEQTLKTSLDALTLSIAQLPANTDITKANEIANDIRRIQQQLKECHEKAKKYNHREKLFEMPLTDYSQIRTLYEEFEPYHKLWLSTSDWQKWYDSWLHDPIEQVDVESLEKSITEVSNKIRQASKAFADIPGVLKVAEEVMQEIENFKEKMLLVQNICHPGMKDRHWEEVSEAISMQIQPKIMALTVSKCFDMGLEKYEGVISMIAEKARKEYSVEQTLDRMEEEWEPVVFDLIPYKTEGANIIIVSDECLQLLDDHIASTETIAGISTKWFEERINKWEKSLLTCQATLGALVQCQDSWLQLEPIFSSKDISRQLPTESISYKSVDWTWQKIMSRCKEAPKVLTFCDDEKLLKQLQDSNQILESLYKCLINYLEFKRTHFPRFYFLSDQELFQIISQAHEPTAIQPHLKRCFQNIHELKFSEELRITAMCSSEGEEIHFRQEFYPNSNVETWLYELECIMKTTLNILIRDALGDYSQRRYVEWMLEWPGQVVTLITRITWTRLLEEALHIGKVFPVYDLISEQLDQLLEIVQKEVPVMKQQILSSLIIIQVHLRDVAGRLRKVGSHELNEFDWISQLRHYNTINGIQVRIMNSQFKYEHEYLGNSSQLAITPLTERCYIAMCSSLSLGYGCAVIGSTGSGKTETIKDLAKAIAVYCIVFSCSDRVDFPVMANFFKGIASAGVWFCLYGFDRTEVEMSSVVAQHVRTIQNAWQRKLDHFTLEGTPLNLKSACSVFLTVGAEYLHRPNFSVNLKVLFRPVSMLTPHEGMIAEIILSSYGFTTSKTAARKIIVAFRLFSQHFSTQNQYDFGIRSIKAVLMVAVTIKTNQPDLDESSILVKAVTDVILPRLLPEDQHLFFKLLSDLFPQITKGEISYGDLKASITNVCRTENLKGSEGFVSKCMQLYETALIYYGIILIGPAASGKTKCYTTLKTALLNIASEDSEQYNIVQTFVIHPKSVTIGQLFGTYDPVTNDWNDGLLPVLLREGVSSRDNDRKWYILDGPIDSVWIENMYSVLDDNKILCLSNGERIKLAKTQSLIFEVDDLSSAAPCMVSRCGIVHMEASIIGLPAIFDSWLQKTNTIIKAHASILRENFITLFLPSLKIILPYQEFASVADNSLTFSLLKLMDSLFLPFAERQADKKLSVETLKDVIALLIHPWFIFSLIWSVGAVCNEQGRTVFSDWLRKELAKQKVKTEIPLEGLVYDYKINDESIKKWLFEGSYEIYGELKLPNKINWIHWTEVMPEVEVRKNSKIFDDLIPTLNFFQLEYLTRLLLVAHNSILCVGPFASGKSTAIRQFLTTKMPDNYITEVMIFSAQTTALQTQDAIDRKLDRRKRGTFGPPRGKQLIFFIDDFNMPTLEEDKSQQQPLELLRQWMDFHGWYDHKSVGSFRHIIDVNFIGAMGPSAGGQRVISPRLLHHFNILSFTEMDDITKEHVCGTFLYEWFGDKTDMKVHAHQLIISTIAIHKKVCSTLLPVPLKCHYIFNFREILRVFQGMLMANINRIQDLTSLLRLWIHENCRIFRDRLVNDEEGIWFDKLMEETIKDDFNLNYYEIIGKQPLLFADFVVSTTHAKEYQEVPSYQELKDVVETYMYDYNEISPTPLKLVMFEYALNHICRLCRILSHTQGNVLLLGVPGSGRRSLACLAAYIANHNCTKIKLSKDYGVREWKEDLKKLLIETGIENKTVAFFFSDNQVKNEIFLEDINSLLNSSDLQNIMEAEDTERIQRNLKPVLISSGITVTKANIYSAFVQRIRANLHILISMNPLGETFRRRLMEFPSFISYCTIDWFHEWPKSAFQAVAAGLFEKMPQGNIGENDMNNLIIVMLGMHQSIITLAADYSYELSRCVYVTRANYVELVNTFIQLFMERKEVLLKKDSKMKQCLNKLEQATTEAKKLQEKCEKLKPILSQTITSMEEKNAEITSNMAVMESTKVHVDKTRIAAREAKTKTDLLENDVQKDLNVAILALEAAHASLKTLNKEEFNELCYTSEPAHEMKMVMETLCVMFNVEPNIVLLESQEETIEDYWTPAMELLKEPEKLLHNIFSYDKENVSEDIIDKITPFIDNPRFTPDSVSKVSNICTIICRWVQAIYKYHFVTQVVAPKREILKESQKILQEKMEAFNKVVQILNAADEVGKKLEKELNNFTKRKQNLQAELAGYEERLSRASSMFDRLAEHQLRWKEAAEEYKHFMENLSGDILKCTGYVVYLGSFTMEYRTRIVKTWLENFFKYRIPHSDKTFIEILGDPMKIKQWQIAGLPPDDISIENALISHFSLRWPLFIDPQEQAQDWIKNMEEDSDLQCIKLSDKDFVDMLCAKIRFGKPCLLEDVAEKLDPFLEPLLLKEICSKEGATMLKIGDLLIPYDKNFRFYITTKLPNPRYGAHTFMKVNIINFSLSSQGIKDNFLAHVIGEERKDLEDAKKHLILSATVMKEELEVLKAKVIEDLVNTKGSPIDDIEMLNSLEVINIKCHETEYKICGTQETESSIDSAIIKYLPVAERAFLLYSCLHSLRTLNPMYVFTIGWFKKIFSSAIAAAEAEEYVEKRSASINRHLTGSMYAQACCSMFHKHKLMFAFLICCSILIKDGKIRKEQWIDLLSREKKMTETRNPFSSWLSNDMWNEICKLSENPEFNNLQKSILDLEHEFKTYCNSPYPQSEPLPGKWEEVLTEFEILLLIKCLRPDMLYDRIQTFITNNLGKEFIEPKEKSIAELHMESTAEIPIILIYEEGTDPANKLNKFAQKEEHQSRFVFTCMIKRKNLIPELIFDKAIAQGNWLVYENCHLFPNQLPQLQRMIESINQHSINPEFRLWLTTMPSEQFPVGILHRAVKMTVERPHGIKAHLLAAYEKFDDAFLESCEGKGAFFKPLLFSLCLFHAVISERSRFGTLGFNVPYEFMDDDLRISYEQLSMFVKQYLEMPYKMLNYTTGMINYGGRVIDKWDLRCLTSILQEFFNPSVMTMEHEFGEGGAFHQLPESTQEGYLEYLHCLPVIDPAGIFGVPEIAVAKFSEKVSSNILNDLYSLESKTNREEKQLDEEVAEFRAKKMLSSLPKSFDEKHILTLHPLHHDQCLNAVLIHEVKRYNILLSAMRKSLEDLLHALKGLVKMSDDLERMVESLSKNVVPNLWVLKAYPSLRGLGAWFMDLLSRLKFIGKWVQTGIPNAFWIAAFYNPEAFLAALMLNYSRKRAIPIDTIDFTFEVLNVTENEIYESPERGGLIYGLYLEGARWDGTFLAETQSKELRTKMPIIWLNPEEGSSPVKALYNCPVYRTASRADSTTTYVPSNYIFSIDLPCTLSQSHWIKRGVALLCDPEQ